MRVVISDTDSSHATTVRSAVISAYNSLTESDFEIRLESLNDSLLYASSNGAEMVIRSTAGIPGYVLTALAYYPDIQVVMPLGSNTYEELTALSEITNIIATGAGDTQNRTGYGNGLEFWDDDNGNPGDLSSFSNGVIAGKLLAIKDHHQTNWFGARSIARQSTGQSWTKFNGFGKIDLATAYAIDPETESYYEENDPFIPHVSEPTITSVSRAYGGDNITVAYSTGIRRDVTTLYADGVSVGTATFGTQFTVEIARTQEPIVFTVKNEYTNAYNDTEEATSTGYRFSHLYANDMWFAGV